MLRYRDCQSLINGHLSALPLPDLPSNLYDPIRYILDLEAKRLRPVLVIMGCNIFTEDIQPAVLPALAVEVFHNFTLMHDDIMDQSVMRRNSPTVHIRWSNNIALLSGDAMLIKAYEILSGVSGTQLQKILPVFNHTALQVCEGQQHDMDYEHRHEISIEEYIRMVEYKTAVLLAASLKIGALSGGAGEEAADCLYDFGRNIGIAFQLQDDLLDVFSDPAVFGKVTGNDIVSNKKTILLTEALMRATGKLRDELLDWLNRTDFNRDEKVEAVRSIYRRLNLEESVTERIRHYHALALDRLTALEASPDRKSVLLTFSAGLIDRKK